MAQSTSEQNKQSIAKASEGRYIGDGHDTSAPTAFLLTLLSSLHTSNFVIIHCTVITLAFMVEYMY
jgi:hypothetical protein